jgi:putative Mg2+ transporter-C (MgtC) family protein
LDTNITAIDIVLRIAAAFAAGALLGYNRGEHGHAAGLRTTILVTMAACATMVLAFSLLPAKGHDVGFFTRMDVMRLPLGILTGIGFIGAGAIARRGDLVTGVTTAATIWMTTIIGLVLGTGMFVYGAGLTLITFVVVWAIKLIEPKLRREHRAILALVIKRDGPDDDAIRALLHDSGFAIAMWSVTFRDGGAERKVRAHLEWMSRRSQAHPPECFERLGATAGVQEASWWPHGAGETSV